MGDAGIDAAHEMLATVPRRSVRSVSAPRLIAALALLRGAVPSADRALRDLALDTRSPDAVRVAALRLLGLNAPPVARLLLDGRRTTSAPLRHAARQLLERPPSLNRDDVSSALRSYG
jgi:hypothetical protein